MASTVVLTIARQQFGIVHRDQLRRDAAMSEQRIARARTSGQLIEVLPSTYRLASNPDTFLARAMAVQLWAGGVGFLSSWSAARLHGLRKMPGDVVHFTVPHRVRRRTPEWVHLDRTSWSASTDHQQLGGGLVVATPLRMLFGLAADFNQHRFNRAAEDAWHLTLTTPDQLREYLEVHRCRGKDGVARIESWLEETAGQQRPAQSYLERVFIEAFRRIGLPRPVAQHPLTLTNGEIVKLDIAWPGIRLAVEPGSSWFHGGDAGQARDHDRDLGCMEVGWIVIRLDETFKFDADGAARRVARAYHRRAAERRSTVA